MLLFSTRGQHDIDIGTVDGFQGREKDVIVLSCVRARNKAGTIGQVSQGHHQPLVIIKLSSPVYHPPGFTVILLSSSSSHPHHIRLCDQLHIISILTPSSHHLTSSVVNLISSSSHHHPTLILLLSSSLSYLPHLIIILILSSNSSHLHFSFSSFLPAVFLNMPGYFICCYDLFV